MKPALVALAVVTLAAGVWWLRAVTISRDPALEHGTRTEVVVEGAIRLGEPTQTLEHRVHAVILTCRIETAAEIVEGPTALSDTRLRYVLEPSLGNTDERQFRGCVEDWTIDGVLVDVVSLESS